MESLLVSQPGVDPSYMTESEFITAASEQVLTVYDRLQRHLFKEAIAYVTQLDGIHDGVPVLRLARILYGIGSKLGYQLSMGIAAVGLFMSSIADHCSFTD